METSPYTLADLVAGCERGAATLEREAAELAGSDAGRSGRKLLAAATVRRYVAEHLVEPFGEGVPGAATLVGWCAEMGGILMDGSGRTEVERAQLHGLALAGYMTHVAEPGQLPFFALTGYMPAR